MAFLPDESFVVSKGSLQMKKKTDKKCGNFPQEGGGGVLSYIFMK